VTSRLVKVGRDCVLYRGDCTGPNAREITQQLVRRWGPIHVISADPPYGEILKIHWEKKAQAAYEFYQALANEASFLLDYGASAFFFGGIGRPKVRPFLKSLLWTEERTDLLCAHFLTWNKRRAYGKAKDYLFTREEMAWYVKTRAGQKPNPNIFNIPLLKTKRGYAGYNPKYPAKSEFKRRNSVWMDIGEYFRGKVHDAQKPAELYKVIYETHSNPGGFVIDWCAGSGEAALAARELGRKILLIEKGKDDFDKMVERLR
jgi:DNA modification methylase